jgi:hypothetical protein
MLCYFSTFFFQFILLLSQNSEQIADLSFNLSLKIYDLLMKLVLSVIPNDQVTVRVRRDA